MPGDDDEPHALGPCCVCESTVAVQTFIMLPQKAPMPGRGWGCVVCGLSSDGAVAVVCDSCAAAYDGHLRELPLRFACRGYPAVDGRVPIADLAGTHDHDFARHPDEPDTSPLWPKPGFEWGRVRWTGPLAPVDDTCSYCGAAIPDECVPLRLWSKDGWAAVFCDACMVTWWGMETFPDEPDDVDDAAP